MSGRAARPIEAILADVAAVHRQTLTLSPAPDGAPGAAAWALEGLSDGQWFYVFGRFEAARYAPSMRLRGDEAVFLLTWADATDEEARPVVFAPASDAWPERPDLAPGPVRDLWQLHLPYSRAAPMRELEQAVSDADSLARRDLGERDTRGAARRLTQFAERYGGTPAARRKAGQRDERAARRGASGFCCADVTAHL